MKILLVHWDETAGRGLRQALQRMGHAVLLASDDQTLQEMLKRRPNVILVESTLVEIDGRQLFEDEAPGPFPLLMAIPPLPEEEGTAAADGASESVLTQNHQRVATRVLRQLRRLIRRDAARLKVGDLTVYPVEKRVLFHGRPLRLTPLQFTLLSVLALQPGRVFSPGELLENVWGYEADDAAGRELLKVHIRRLRQKMRAISPEGADYIQSIRGFGYRLAPPQAQED